MKTARTSYVLAIGIAVATALFLVLAAGALGIIGDGGRPDRVYAGVLAVGVLGTLVARLRPRGMALALLATALAQVLITLGAVVAGLPGEASLVDVLAINAMYAGLWGVSAWLFRQAAERSGS